MERTPLPIADPPRNSRAPRPGGRGVRLLVAGLLLIPLAACATKADVRDLQSEIRELAARQEALMREMQSEQRTQRDSMRMLSRRVGDQGAQLSRDIRLLADEVIRLREFAGMSQQEISALRDQMERRPTVSTPQPGRGAAAPQGGEAQELYDLSLSQFQRENFTSAQMGFEEIIERFPNHTSTPDARYYLADIYLQRGDVDEAIRRFLQIPEFHPASERVPHALYRVGMIHLDRDERGQARAYFERVVNTWPDSPAAELAEEALRRIG